MCIVSRMCSALTPTPRPGLSIWTGCCWHITLFIRDKLDGDSHNASNGVELLTMLLFCLTLNVGFTTESAEVDNTWSRQDNYILCTHIKMETIQQNYIWKCISTVSHDKSSRNKERCGVNASCMLYSFKIVFPTRQVFSTSALSVVKPTFNVRQNNSIVHC